MSHNNTIREKEVLLSSDEATFLVIFNSIQVIFGSIANALEIIFFWTKRSEYNSISDTLTFNLAVSDFVAVTTYLPWRTYLLHLRRKTDDSKYYTSLFVFCIFSTGNAVLLIGIDRFISIIRPLRYHALLTNKVVYCGMALAWGTAIIMGIIHFFSYKHSLNIHRDFEFFLSCLSIGHLIALTIIYTVVLKAARKQVKNLQLLATRCRNPDTSSDSSSSLYYKNRSYTALLIVCLFYGTFLPYSLYRIISTFNSTMTIHEKRITWRWLISFSFLNSCLNPFIYFIGMRKFRSGFKKHVFLRSYSSKNLITSL